MRVPVLIAALLAAACTPVPVVKTVCPPIKEYDAEFLQSAARDMERLPGGSPVAQLVVDYRQLRDVIRACEAR